MKLIIMALVLASSSLAKEKVLSVKYVKSLYAGVHQNKSKYSVVLTTISCGFPVKVLGEAAPTELDFAKVKVGMHTGYIKSNLLSTTQLKCFQDKYPRFVDHLDLDLENLHYFGRLYDLYVEGESSVK